MNECIKKLKECLEVHGRDGNWNYSPYMLGIYNGIEVSLSLLENRDPVYREHPEHYYIDK